MWPWFRLCQHLQAIRALACGEPVPANFVRGGWALTREPGPRSEKDDTGHDGEVLWNHRRCFDVHATNSMSDQRRLDVVLSSSGRCTCHRVDLWRTSLCSACSPSPTLLLSLCHISTRRFHATAASQEPVISLTFAVPLCWFLEVMIDD